MIIRKIIYSKVYISQVYWIIPNF